MAPAGKKKKKPAQHPARGFATQSIASKPKIAKSADESSEVSKDVTENASDTASPALINHREDLVAPQDHNKRPDKELHELSPEELGKRLEEADLQSFVEKYSAKVQRDSSRFVTKYQTECRLLRPQAQPLHTRQFLPDSLVVKVLELATAEVNAGKHFVDDELTRKVPTEEDFTSRLWTLQRILIGLGFAEQHVHAALTYVVHYPPSLDADASVWGLEQCLDWLALNVEEYDLPKYDAQTGKVAVLTATSSASDTAPDPDPGYVSNDGSLPPVNGHKKPSPTEQPPTAPEDDLIVSDLESDLEPEELLSVYLRSKAVLYEKRPELSISLTKTAKGKKKRLAQPKETSSAGIAKMQSKLQRIESDVLFDQREADMQWENQRILLAREEAERRRLNLSQQPTPNSTTSANQDVNGQQSRKDSVSPEQVQEASVDGDSGDDSDNAFGDLFGSVTATEGAQPLSTTPATGSFGVGAIVIRDFGPSKGMEPRRVLEEACRARDSGVKLHFKLISSTAFSNRHSVQILWSKEQSAGFPIQDDSVGSVLHGRRHDFTMTTVASPDSHQSLAYISVFALFQIFSTSSREEKVYLRLPPTWRNLWLELSESSKAQAEAIERDSVQALRSIISSRPEQEIDDDVVLTNNFKKRNGESGKRESRSDLSTSQGSEQRMQEIWASKQSTQSFQHMLNVRKSLPMWQFKDEALTTVERHQVTIICGETGCGKSTQMPSFILERELSSGRPCKIYCTEPRRISAITLAQRVSEELGESKRDLGTIRSLVGYAIRLESMTSSATRLVYATTGIVLRMLESSGGLADITHVIIDEVHERSIETDFLLIILRTLILKRPDLKVVLMSATVDAQRFSQYFHGAPVLNVPGRTFPVETKYLEDAIELTGHVPEDGAQEVEDSDDVEIVVQGKETPKVADDTQKLSSYSKRTRATLSKYNEYQTDYALIARLIESLASEPELSTKYGKAILVFLPGIAEIRRMNDTLTGSWIGQKYLIHSLHSSIASEDQTRAFALPPPGMGKIVLSTNIAETGVTIPDVTCVIDTGKHKEMRFDEKRQVSRLLESFISRANAKQRRGRAGRVQAGLCFHLFTKARHDEIMSDQQTPEMLRLSLQDLVMRVKICKLGDIEGTLADALDPPSAKNIRRAIDALIEVGALTGGEQLTALGQQLSKLPLDPYLGKLVLYGSIFGCLDVALTLAVLLTSRSPFLTPIDARKQADLARVAFKKGDSDLHTEYNAYSAWRRICQTGSMPEQQFCRKNMLSLQTLSNIEDLKAQLFSALSDAGFVNLTPEDRSNTNRSTNSTNHRTRRFLTVPASLTPNTPNTTLTSTLIAWSFYPKLLTRDGKGWRQIATSQSVAIHPTSVIRQAGYSASMSSVQFLSFYSILQSGSGARNYNANSLTPVSALGLVLQVGSASWHPVAHVVSVDGARLRFAVDASRQRLTSHRGNANGTVSGETEQIIGTWKTYIALKFLRRRLEETVKRRWKRPKVPLPGVLEGWMGVWGGVVEVWKKADT